MKDSLSNRYKQWMPLMVLPFLLAVCWMLWFASKSVPSVSVQSEGDVWDLREFDFSQPKAVVKLSGPVVYIPNAILTPEEFETRADEAVYGYPEENAQYATSRMRVLIPEGYYGFYCLSTDFAERLYINGHLMLEIGSPGDSRETEAPNTRNQIMTLTPVEGVIEIVTQGSNFVHREGGGHAGWRVGAPGIIDETMRASFLTNIIMGCYLALFLVHLVLFLLLRTYRANLLFALSCLMWLLRSGVTWTKVFSILFPALSWYVKFRIEYLTFPVTAVLFIFLVHTLFPHVLQKWYLYLMSCAMAAFAALFMFADTLFMSWAILWCEGIFFASIVYIAARFAMRLRRVGPEQCVFLAGAGLFVYAAVNDMLHYNNIRPPFVLGDISQISMLAFAFFEAVAIFIATARGLEEAKAQEQRLAARIQMTENQLVLQREQYGRMMQNAETVKSMRHDLRHHLAVLVQLADTGDAGGIIGYVEHLTGVMTGAQDSIYCDNQAVNAVAAHYLGLAQGEGVNVDARLDIPEDTGSVPAMDLCVVMGNLLENALEACRLMTRDGKFIRVRSRIAGGTLSIAVDNSFDGLWREENGAYVSRKQRGEAAPREGVGLSSVKAVCEKHRGLALFETSGDVWRASAVVYMDNALDYDISDDGPTAGLLTAPPKSM